MQEFSNITGFQRICTVRWIEPKNQFDKMLKMHGILGEVDDAGQGGMDTTMMVVVAGEIMTEMMAVMGMVVTGMVVQEERDED